MALSDLTKYEMIARDHFLGLMTDGIIEPLETSDSSMSLPNWFDEKKFDLGREYFMKNRFGILSTNLCGLVMLLALPKGLPIFRAAPKSDYIEGVRKRYLETIMNTLSWYEVQLKNGSRSWDSLQKIRSDLYHGPQSETNQLIKPITQTEMSITAFGFAGLALIRPYLFGISTTNQKERKAFQHFWAVLNNLVGIKDRYNIGLLPIKSTEIELDIIMRNVMAPYVQLETLYFKKKVNDMIKGLQPYIENTDYDSQMFLVRRAVGIPGYQLDVNFTREVPYGNIFSPADVAVIRRALPRFSEKIQIYTIKQNRQLSPSTECQSFDSKAIDPYDPKIIAEFDRISELKWKKLMGLSCTSDIRVKEVDRGPSYLRLMSTRGLSKMSSRSQFNVNLFLALVSLMYQPKGVVLVNQIVDHRINMIRNKNASFNLNWNRIYPEGYVRGPGI